MRSQLRPKTFNTILFLAGMFLIAFSAPKLFRGFEVDQSDRFNSVGSISFVKNDTRLKKSHLFNWSAGNVGSPLAQGDLVFTNMDSEAKLELNEGHEVSLQSQTLLKIKDEELEIREGSVELAIAKGRKAIKIKLGNNHYLLSGKGSAAKVSVSSNDGKSKFLVSQGSLNIKGERINIEASKGEEVIASAQSVSKSDINIEVLYPKSSSIFLRPKEKFQFKVRGAPEGSFALVSSGDAQKKLPLNSDISLAPGQHTWAVANEEGNLTTQRFLDLKYWAPSPVLRAPENLSVLHFFENSAYVNFKWKADSTAKLRVYDSTGRLTLSKGNLSQAYSATIHSEGTYSWQVRAEDRDVESDWSSSNTFVLLKKDYQKGEAIVIELEKPDQLAKFDWKGSKTGDRFVLSRRRNFSSTLREEIVDDQTSYETVVPEVGIYYWKIVKKNGGPSEASPQRVLIRATPPPTKPKAPPSIRLRLKNKSSSLWEKVWNFISPIQTAHADEYEEARVTFEEIEKAKIYEVEIYRDKALKKMVHKVQTKETNFTWSPPRAGHYYWRLRFKDHWERWSPFSDPGRISLSYEKRKNKKRAKKVVRAVPRKRTTSKKIKAPKMAVHHSRVEVGYVPSNISYNQDGPEEFDISGQALGGHGLGLSHKNYGLNYRSSYGRVFNEQPFYNRSLNVFALWKSMSVLIGPSVLAGQTLSYVSDGQEANEGDSVAYYGVGIRISKDLELTKDLRAKFGGSAHALDASSLAVFFNLSYKWRPQIGIGLSLEGEKVAIEKDNKEINIQTIKTFFGPFYDF